MAAVVQKPFLLEHVYNVYATRCPMCESVFTAVERVEPLCPLDDDQKALLRESEMSWQNNLCYPMRHVTTDERTGVRYLLCAKCGKFGSCKDSIPAPPPLRRQHARVLGRGAAASLDPASPFYDPSEDRVRDPLAHLEDECIEDDDDNDNYEGASTDTDGEGVVIECARCCHTLRSCLSTDGQEQLFMCESCLPFDDDDSVKFPRLD